MPETITCHATAPVADATGPRIAPAPDTSRMLRVTHISTTDLRGGAARAAHRLHRTLGAVGVRSHMLVAQRFSNEADIVEYNPSRDINGMTAVVAAKFVKELAAVAAARS